MTRWGVNETMALSVCFVPTKATKEGIRPFFSFFSFKL